MNDYNPQPILKKKWGIAEKYGTIKIKKYIYKKKEGGEYSQYYFAYFVYFLLGKYIWKYLGACDNLGRPLQLK
jgi:hypothetical protein